MMLSREDLLRELELLPMWQLRESTPAKIVNADAKLRVGESNKPEIATNQSEQIAEVFPYSFRLLVSKDAQWAFVVESHNDEAEQLLKNMLKAIAVTIDQDIADATIDFLGQYTPQVLVIMGEEEARQLLNKAQGVEQMRGIPHSLHGTLVIVTYSPNYLLSNLVNKAKVWEDLCLARFTISSLKSDK